MKGHHLAIENSDHGIAGPAMKTVTNRNPLMSFLRKPRFNVLKAAIAVCIAGLLGLAAAVSAQADETINGIAIMPGIERLSYISNRYYGIRESYDDCLNKAQGIIPEQGDCADTELDYQSKRLDAAFSSLLETLKTVEGEPDVATAEAVQKAWLGYYEQDCGIRAGRFGSTPGPATLSLCMMTSTARRAQELEDWRGTLLARSK